MARITVPEIETIMAEELPFAANFGEVVFERLEDGDVMIRMPVDASHMRPGGTVSGPVLKGLADLVMYALVLSRIGPVKLAVTTNLTANFLRRPGTADLMAEGRLIKCGKRLAYGEVTLYSDGEPDDPVCHVTSTYSIPPPEAR
ncbi:MAG: PaaI family thioesterase [Rhodospirillaceae bacterium]|nr:PaaI family thioesterase [Rhodospirillaceae bacterium]